MRSNAHLLSLSILVAATSTAGSVLATGPAASSRPSTDPSGSPPRRPTTGAALPVFLPSSEAPRPAWTAQHPALCADRLPLCVHAPDASRASQLAPALRDLESVAQRTHAVLGWPAPLHDGRLGGSGAFDVYLDPQLRSPYAVSSDPPSDPRGERTSAFARLQPGLPDACFRSAMLAEAYARAGLFGLDARAQDATATASAAYVASVAVECPIAWLDAVNAFQLHPELALSHPDQQHQRGALLFPWFLQQSRGAGSPADLLHALWVFASIPSRTPAFPSDPDEPDFFDVVQSMQAGTGGDLGGALLDFAVARAFVGNRDDGLHMPETRMLGPQGAVQFAWSVPYSSLPRRLAPARPVEPTGASYLWLSLDNVPAGGSLVAQARWEVPDVFRFAFVLVDAQGAAITRFDPVSPQREPVMQTEIERLEGAAGVLVVACNVGSTLPDVAFDPDMLPYTPRGYDITLYAM